MIREKLEQRRKKYASRQRIKLITASFALVMSLGFIHKASFPKTDAYFRYEGISEATLTVTEDIYKMDTIDLIGQVDLAGQVNLSGEINLTVTDDVYKTFD